MPPSFPEFKPVEISDRNFLHEIFWRRQPETSELTFTNVFIWREHYKIHWSMYKDWLVIACESGANKCFALPPVGPAGRAEVARTVLEWLRDARHSPEPMIQRADRKLAEELAGAGFKVSETRDHFDYVYRSEDLIKLSGKKYHSKKNHVNKFRKTYRFSYEPLTGERVAACLEVAELWCKARRCHQDIDLVDETNSVKDSLRNFEALKIQGGLILVEGRVEAFTLGELLNQDTAVIHIEKADPEIPQAFAVINQQFCEHAWATVPFINREQDLGDEGLRQAKLSYHPARLVEKYAVRLGS